MTSASTKTAITKSILQPLTTLKGHGEQIRSIFYYPDGQRMISGSYDKTARQWDLKAGKEIEESRSVCEEKIRAVAVSRDGRWVITAGGESGDYDAGELKAWEVETGIMKVFEGHSSRIACIDISADNKLLASGSWDYTAQIWNLETGKLVADPFKSDDWVGAVRFSMDSKKLAIKSIVGKCFEVWDVQKPMLDVRIGTVHGEAGSTYAPIFWTNKNKNILAAFSFTDDLAKTIYVFDASTLKTVGTPFEGHTNLIRSLTLSSDGAIVVSGSDDNTIKLWAFESRQLLASFDVQDPLTLVLSPDSRQLAYTTYVDNDVHIYNTPPDILAQVASSARNKSTLSDVLKSDATRRPAAMRRRQPIPAIHMAQRAPPTIDQQQPNFLRFLKLLPFSSRNNAVPAVRNNQTQGPLDFSATLPLPPNRLHAESSPLTPLPSGRAFFNPKRFSSDKGKQRAREPKRKPAEVVDVPLGQATYGDAVGVDDGIRPYVLFFCLSWFQKKEKKQVPRPVYDDELEDDEEEVDILNRVAVPHHRVQDKVIGSISIASQSQPRAGPSRLVNNVDILNQVAVPRLRVQHEATQLKPVASRSQPEAGPTRLAVIDEHLEAQSSL